MSDTVHPKIVESMAIANQTVLSYSPESAQGVVNEASAYSISLLMINAVSEQYSASQITNASITTTCAEILKAGAKALT